MELRELKNQIKNNSLDFNCLIFLYKDNKYLIQSYLRNIIQIGKFEVVKSDNLDEVLSQIEVQNSFFSENDNTLYIIDIDKLQNLYDLDIDGHLIIICNEIDKTIKDKLKNYVVEFPKLEKWQIESFASVQLKGLSKEEINWLCTITNYDIYRLSEEIDKLKIFDKQYQEDIFNLLNRENGYEDLTELNIFNLINAITKRNKDDVLKVLKSKDNIDIEPVGLVTLLSKQFKNLLSIQSNPRICCSDLGITEKQFNAIKYNCGKYTTQELINIYELLTSIDYQLKSGNIDNEQIIDYVVCNIL